MIPNIVNSLIHEMARRTGTTLTDEHFPLLEYAYHYYETHGVGPLYGNIERNTGARKRDIDRLFPSALNSLYTWVGIPIHSPDENCKPMAKIDVDNPREVYLDHNATTYIRDEVKALLVRHYAERDIYGNPSSSTNAGKEAYDLVAEARSRISGCLRVSADEIVFVGGGSEANNLAIKGIANRCTGPAHFITSRTEHSAVLEPLRHLERQGHSVTVLDVEPEGHVAPEAVRAALRPDTALVAVMAVNNEIGVINPLDEIGAHCRDAGVPLFVDAIQGFGRIPLDPKSQGITMLSLSGHKIYGPKGVAALYVDDRQPLAPLLHGGGQEGGRRSGTENVDAIMAFGHAAELIHAEREPEHVRQLALREYFLERLLEIEPELIINGSLRNRTANNLSVGFDGIDSGSLLLSLNQIGVYVSAGSACHAGGVESSHVIEALGVDTDRYGTIRFGLGLRTTREELDYVIEHLPRILGLLRSDQVAA
ncbi:MAG: aminotransferase class V-fold PLP-dependent enzyme [Planctomycetota bacterium]|jgi:cysteine desulfurase